MGSRLKQVANRGRAVTYLIDSIGNSFTAQCANEARIPLLYAQEKRSIHEIARQLGLSRDAVRGRLRAAGVPLRKGRPPQAGPRAVPYGWRREEGGLVRDEAEQRVIAKIRRDRAEGRSLHAIARELSDLGVKTKTGGRWHAKTVSQIIAYQRRRAE
jgi:transposase-like protein